MILDNDNKVKTNSQTALFQMKIIEDTASRIKEYAEIGYTSRVTEQIYSFETNTYTKYLVSFYVSPIATIFEVSDKLYAAKDQEKVLQWFMERVEYSRKQNMLSENEIICFGVS